VLISHDGYSVTDPLTGERLVRNRDSVRTFAALASDHLSFTLPDSGESIAVFGLWGGDGSHVTADGWALEVIYPWWPNVDVLLRRPRSGPVGGYFEGSSLIEGLGTVTWLGCGFSPSGRCFMLLGSDGPKIYVR
jgi:hypothetical protein